MSTDKLVSKSDLQDFYNRILPYLGGTAEAGFTPVGTVISVMGKTAPANYLACDGSVYNIADYPELANYFLQQFESKSYFGGDGTTTFAVPDLQGEFLRGAGTNSHTNQGSGGEVGEHQDGTLHVDVHIGSDGKIIYSGRINNTNTGATQIDYQGTQVNLRGSSASSSVSTTTSNPYYTSRPTNTSVLFCIATKNIYLNPSLDYSTDEKVVGSWLDGKTLYQKTFQTDITVPSSGTVTNVKLGQISSDFENVVEVTGFTHQGTSNFVALNRPSPVCQVWVSEVTVDTISKGDVLFVATSATDLRGTTTVFCTVRYTKTTD